MNILDVDLITLTKQLVSKIFKTLFDFFVTIRDRRILRANISLKNALNVFETKSVCKMQQISKCLRSLNVESFVQA